MIFSKFVLWFAFYSFVGWAFECVYYSLLDQKIVNSGFLRGPYCPVYGFGAIAVALALGSIENPIAIFFISILITGSIEYFTGWLLEKLFHARWWDYSNMPFNINGRVFPLSLLCFGVMSLLVIKCFQPMLNAFTAGLKPETLSFLAGAFCMALCIDIVHTVSRLKKPRRPLADRANECYRAALRAIKPLRMARGAIEKVVWGGRPVQDHGGPTIKRDDDAAKENGAR